MKSCSEERKRSRPYRTFSRKGAARRLTSSVDGALDLQKNRFCNSEAGSPRSQDALTEARSMTYLVRPGGTMRAARAKAKRSIRRKSRTLATARTGRCKIVVVGKRRDGGTRYWCLKHRADATAKYGRRA